MKRSHVRRIPGCASDLLLGSARDEQGGEGRIQHESSQVANGRFSEGE